MPDDRLAGSGAVRVDRRLVGEVYNVMHPNGWRWEQLTTGEADSYGEQIESVLGALSDAGYDIVKRALRAEGTP